MGELSKSRHHYLVLDGLRGIAAICVMMFHRRVWLGGDGVLGHAYLAVDFFFMLSAFVLTHAYAERLASKTNLLPFMRDRLFRLHPMLIAGALIAALVAYLESLTGATALYEHPLATFLASLVPIPAFWTSSPTAFPWNLPVWSLFWELLASLAAGAFLITASFRVLIILTAIFGIALITTTIWLNGAEVGFSNDQILFWLGAPRVLFAFSLGTLVYHLHNRINIKTHRYGWLCCLFLVTSFTALPRDAAGAGVYDAVMVSIVFPLLILFAARADAVMPRFCVILGAVSYPLYILHEPTLKIVAGGFRAIGLSSGGAGQMPALPEAFLRFAAVFVISYIALKIYDEPVRAYLKTWLKKRKDKHDSAVAST